MNVRVSGWLAAAGLLLATACSTDQPTVGGPDNGVTDGEVTVSFAVTPAGRVYTRAEGNGSLVQYPDTAKGEFPQISDGTKAHVLIYAVYDSEKKLLEQYGNELTEEVRAAAGLPDSYVLGEGQTLLNIATFPTDPIKLRLMRNKTYYVAFWAQAAACTAYDTSDLTTVKVSYDDAKCNDELRDVFCHTEELTVTMDEERTIILTRPLAQINLGTAGFDFEAAADLQDTYLYSKFIVKGVSEYLDVVSNKVLMSQADFDEHGLGSEYGVNGLVDVEFDWARIPAYYNYGGDETLFDETSPVYPEAQLPSDMNNWKTAKEQFLRVDRNFDGEYAPYMCLSEFFGLADPTKAYTETYKYLAMCYVLVPFMLSENVDNDTRGAVVDEVSIELAQAKVEEGSVEIDETTAKTVIDGFTNVPVMKNWRTNILSNSLLTIYAPYAIDVVPDYNGEYNRTDDGFDENQFPEFPEFSGNGGGDSGENGDDGDENE